MKCKVNEANNGGEEVAHPWSEGQGFFFHASRLNGFDLSSVRRFCSGFGFEIAGGCSAWGLNPSIHQ